MKSINLHDKEVFLKIGAYAYSDRLAILSNTVDGIYSNVTVNLPELYLDSINEAFIDSMCKDCGLYQALIDNGIIKEVIKEKVPYNMGRYDLVKFDMDKLREYDPKGYETFLNELGYSDPFSLNSVRC